MSDTTAQSGFSELTPDVLLEAVEGALAVRLTALAHPLTSYINRVYEVAAGDGTRYIAKFYRPGRWTAAAIEQEHAFVVECAAEEIPVVSPLRLSHGGTRGEAGGISFAVYPKRAGRPFEPIDDEDWRRLGRVTARVHVVGGRRPAADRVRLWPQHSTAADIRHLLDGGFVTARHRRTFADLGRAILDVIIPVFEGCEAIRIHGDCHPGNLLERPGEGLMVIDFDDMAMGPPVQDLWMLLPERLPDAARQMRLILEGYEDFREFDDRTLRLIEPLRIMRILYFLAWCSRQTGDPVFSRNFPDWGNDAFWGRQIADLTEQLDVIRRGRPA
ncbi:MAG: serine/threonine protein kinase [Lentisphaerae bacterium ADurb.BinA184]|nr:MAG: serine/threonine protein kinase [Lentisphaerae bacterium ADurb.BinA184]